MPLSSLTFSCQEIEAVKNTLESGWWTYGPVARLLEDEFAAFAGTRHAVSVSSGTAALHLALLAVGLRSGDEVIIPSLSFVAAANAVIHAGGLPRFADVSSVAEPLVSSETIERAVTPATRGVCVMHYGGYSCAMHEIQDLCRRRGLWLMEDAAHAPGAMWQDLPCGAWGDIGCFSFFGNKNIACGEGGMVVTGRSDLAARIRSLRSHGMTSLTWDRYCGHKFSYDVVEPGYNYRLDDLRAALLRVQLRSLERFNALRRQRVAWYRSLLERDDRWVIPFNGRDELSACHLFAIVLAPGLDRDRIMRTLRDHGIQTSIHYPPTHQFGYFRKLCRENADLRVTEALGERLLTLPLFPELSSEQVNLVCSCLQSAAC